MADVNKTIEPEAQMNYTQNAKIEQVTEKTVVVGIDIGSQEHYARAFDWRSRELTKKVFRFSADIDGFNRFDEWLGQICLKHGKTDVLVGCEPTGHYWFTLEEFLKSHGKKLAFVNPASVKKAKELDDNSPKKTDQKDPKTIAKLVIDGRYSFPYVPEDIYADLREVVSSRERILKELNAAANRIQRWLKIYFPEYLEVYKGFDSVTGMMILEAAPLPAEIIALGAEGIKNIWHSRKVRGKGASYDRAQILVEAAHNSIGRKGGTGARMEIQMLIEDYKRKDSQLEKVTKVMEEMTMQVPNAGKLLSVDGVGIVTAAGFISEIGDISRFKNPKQIQKYAGLELVENSSGKHKGQTSISRRGRKRLRKILYQVVLPLIRGNKEFREIYEYYRNRGTNPLKGRQSIIVLSCKLIRIFYAILKKGVEYNPEKMRTDIHRMTEPVAA